MDMEVAIMAMEVEEEARSIAIVLKYANSAVDAPGMPRTHLLSRSYVTAVAYTRNYREL